FASASASDAKNGAKTGDFFSTDGQVVDSGPTLKRLNDVPHEYHLIENEEDAAELCRILLSHDCVAFDTETTSTDAISAELVGMSFAVEGHKAWYVAVGTPPLKWGVIEALRPFFESEHILKVGQNMKYDLTVLASYGIEVRGPLFDTMLAHYVVQPELRHNMDYMAEVYLKYQTIHYDDLFERFRALGPRAAAGKTMRDLDPREVVDYACEDADVTLCLKPVLEAEMEKSGVRSVFDNIEMPLMPVLSRMERNGVVLDTAALAETENLFRQRMETLENEIYTLAGEEFLLTSPRQVGVVLFERLKISDKVKKTKTGQYSTSEDVLESLRTKHPIVGKILDHRGLKKLLSTYIEALPKLINPKTGHIHTSFNQAVTATGRLSSSNPNLQNIPVRGEDGKEIRKAFIPEPGCTFFSVDYSQIELRIMAHLSGDENMIRDFNDGADIHAATAARVFKKPLDSIDRDERRKAKTANFGIIYGISAFGLAERMEVSRSEAKELITSYFETYPRVKEYMNASIERARDKGYIVTEFGRRRYLADINSHNATVRGYAERNAVNAPIQGTAADVMKLAMIAVDRRMREEGLRSKMILQVHDELNFSVYPDELDRLRRLVVEEMERAYTMQVPLLAECGEGQNWLEAH
ncbi:MAG: DNA polymerase I, partial [Bacteroidales bacterium]|nr:DNA polymerase I [Bacteroidales bacterium]